MGSTTAIRVSDRDLRSVSLYSLELMDEGSMNSIRERLRAPISTLMNPDVITTYPGADISEVIELMRENKVGGGACRRSVNR